MTGFFLTPAAEADLEEIWAYTVGRWGLDQAERYMLAIRDACRDLADGTRQDRDASGIRAGYRKLAVGAHVLFFRRDGDGAPEIIRVLHRSMDAPRHV